VASTDSGERRRTYAEWYVWSARNLTSASEIQHACAEAATEAKEDGRDPATAARAAAQNRSGPGWTHPASPAVRSYAEWYDWARTTLGLSGEARHDAAAAAIAEMDRGGDAAAAATAAGQPVANPLPGSATQATMTPPAQTPALTPPQAQPPTPYGAAGAPPPPRELGSYGGAYPPQPGYATGYAPSAPAYEGPVAARGIGPVGVPVWVAILLGFGGGISILLALVFFTAIFSNPNSSGQLTAGIFVAICLLIFAISLVALLGIIQRAGWARVMTIVAGIALCLACVLPLLYFAIFELVIAGACLLLGIAIIIGAATAKRVPQSI
jgi:hypothetical protein